MSPSRTAQNTEKQAASRGRAMRGLPAKQIVRHPPPDGMMCPSAIDYLSPNIAIGTVRGLSSAVRHLQLF
eukprot:scaffold220976_cov18-Prasinocladus_malaysianus.AAC.1